MAVNIYTCIFGFNWYDMVFCGMVWDGIGWSGDDLGLSGDGMRWYGMV